MSSKFNFLLIHLNLVLCGFKEKYFKREAMHNFLKGIVGSQFNNSIKFKLFIL